MREQDGVFVEGNTKHWFLEFSVDDPTGVAGAVASVLEAADGVAPSETVELVVGFGASLARRLFGDDVPGGLREFQGVVGPDRYAPATPADLFFWVHSDRHDRNFEVALAARRAVATIGSLLQEVAAGQYRDSRDLTGFIDGTENPDAGEGRELAVIADGPGAGGALLFAQRWIHNLDGFHALDEAEQEGIIGRTKLDSVELDPVPDNSHIGRVVIEDEAGEERELYRRSVPYGTAEEAGLYFLAVPDDFTLIEQMLDRMFGIDGPADRITYFSRAVSGTYLFAPSADALDALIEGSRSTLADEVRNDLS